tara:strand:+ start:50562 stop:50876 length:315 start_codon:yes stop_codon:yes gene_type:complete
MSPQRLKERVRDFDLDDNGETTQEEIDQGRAMLDLELAEEKSEAQRRMALGAMAAIIGSTALILSPVVSVNRVAALSDLMGLFYISMAGIVGAYMGVSAWMSRR